MDQGQQPADPKKSILIIDDDRYNRDFYQELLQDNGFVVETAENGQVGIDKMSASAHFDLIFLDIVMPEKDGMETLTFLQTRPDIVKKHGPIYMLSALGQESVVENARTLGSSGFIVKSDITPDQFLRKVREILAIPSPSVS
jgi:CheY-like chemotaxis protein